MNMKKGFLACLLCFCLIFTGASADGESLTAQWKTDYDTMKLTLSVQSPVKYNQRITAVMYPYGTAAAMDNYSRISEITVVPGSVGVIELKLGDDLNAEGGRYTVDIAGSGVAAAQSKATLDVYLLSPSTAAQSLAALNSTQSSDVGGDTDAAVRAVAKTLKLNIDSDEKVLSAHLAAFLSARRDDYNGSFSSLNDAAVAWNFAEIAVYLSGDSVDPAVLRSMIEANADAVDLDVSGDDYVKYADKIYADLCRVRLTYGDGGLKSAASIKDALAKYTAVEAINAADMESIKGVVDKYYKVLEITDAQMAKLNGYTEANQAKVFRQLYNKAYTEPGAVKADFDAAMAQNFDDTTTSGSGNGSSSGSGGKGTGGGVSLTPSTTPVPPAKSDFADCTSAHWAYEYVTALRNSGIIDGYEDGTFRPDNGVTREEFVKLIISAAGMYSADAQCAFTDVPSGEWYYSFVASAVESDAVSGISADEFGIGQPITREDAAVIAARILGKLKNVTAGGEMNFTDREMISDYAADSVSLLSQLGIINGFEDGSFAPQSGLTRAQTAKIIAMIRNQI